VKWSGALAAVSTIPVREWINQASELTDDSSPHGDGAERHDSRPNGNTQSGRYSTVADRGRGLMTQNGSAFFNLFQTFLAADGLSSRRGSSRLCGGDLLDAGVAAGVGVTYGVGVAVGVD